MLVRAKSSPVLRQAMNVFLAYVLTNIFVVTGLFAIVYAVGMRIRNPAVLHVLWVLVLLKLLVPPMWAPRLAVLPAAAMSQTPALPRAVAALPDETSGDSTTPKPADEALPDAAVAKTSMAATPDANPQTRVARRTLWPAANPLAL